ncbi:MAG TPA: FxsA family protein [Acidimicrobiia bacterium]|nr:FxsA family protein [Acidimicrobiia bacterium]
MAVFALLFIVLPLVEIYVAVQVAHLIGALSTVGLLLGLSLAGVWVTKFAGLGALARIRRQLQAGRMPTNELIDGALGVSGGLLLIVPGFVTAAAGLLLLFPPTRTLTREAAKRRFVGRVTYFPGPSSSGPIDGPSNAPDDVIDI